MRTILIFFIFIGMTGFNSINDFKKEQLGNARVKAAYKEKKDVVFKLLASKSIDTSSFTIFIRIFKYEKSLEVWAKNRIATTYILLKEYDICANSGELGPKRKEGDGQMPEGFYNIFHFNPFSNFYLSLGVSYPNQSDRVLSDKTHPGGNIYIHGNCVTIGCFPITDDKIKELYLLAVEAKNNGQNNIQVHIFPSKLNEDNWKKIKTNYAAYPDLINFWENLKTGYDYFEKNKTLPKVIVDAKGKYGFE